VTPEQLKVIDEMLAQLTNRDVPSHCGNALRALLADWRRLKEELERRKTYEEKLAEKAGL
jgi:hypothetical protein